jgi:hypothetical protein
MFSFTSNSEDLNAMPMRHFNPYRLARRWWPLVWGFVLVITTCIAWHQEHAPIPIPGPLISCALDGSILDYQRDAPFLAKLSMRFADIIAVGDSRTWDLEPDVFKENLGLREVSNASSAFDYCELTTRLEPLRNLPPKKLIVSLTCIDLGNAMEPRTESDNNPQWVRCRGIIDKSLDTALQRESSKYLRFVSAADGLGFRPNVSRYFTPFSLWMATYPTTINPDSEGYIPMWETSFALDHDIRERTLPLIAQRLDQMREQGWQIVCVRLPVGKALLNVEDTNFPPQRFVQFCDENRLPLLDYSHAPFSTWDGSHLDASEAMRFTRLLTTDLRSKFGW